MLIATAIILCILFSAIFSGLEIAYISSNKMQLELDIKKGDVYSFFLNKFSKSPKEFIVGMLVGNNIALVVYGILMGDFLAYKLSDIPFFSSPFLLLFTQTIISTLLVITFAEFIPKAIFRNFANHSLKIFSIPAYAFLWMLYPINVFVIYLSSFFIKFISNHDESIEQTGVRDELRYLLSDHMNENKEEDVESEIQIFHNALAFSEIKARECMVPRNEIYALEVTSSLEELRQMFIETGLSKILIFKEKKDNIIGYVHSFGIFKKPKNISSIILPVEFVYEINSAKDILDNLLKKKKSVAVVLDEYGGTAGMLTVEDIVEELFGEIEDEHDSEELLETIVNDKEYLFSARLEIDYINEKYNLELPQDDSYETLGGFIFNHLGSIPQEGEEFRVYNNIIRIEKAGNTKVDVIKLIIIKD